MADPQPPPPPPPNSEPETPDPASVPSEPFTQKDTDRIRRHPSPKEPSQKRRRVGDEAGATATFRHFAYALQTKAACLMFCCKQQGNRRSPASAATAGRNVKPHPLAALPREIVALVARFVIAAAEHCAPVVRFASPSNLQCVAELLKCGEAPGRALSAVASPDGRARFLALGRRDRRIELFDLDSRESVAVLTVSLYIKFVLSYVDDDGASVVVACSDQAAFFWDVASRTPIGALIVGNMNRDAVVCFQSAAGVPFLAIAESKGAIKLWNLRTRAHVSTLYDGEAEVCALCAFRDSSGADFVVSGNQDSTIQVWDVASGQTVHQLRGHKDYVEIIACFTSEEGVPMLVSAAYNEALAHGSGQTEFKVWDMMTGQEVATTIPGSDGVVLSLVCVAGADGRVLLAASYYDEIVLSDLSTGDIVFQRSLEVDDDRQVIAFVDHQTGSSVLAVCGSTAKQTEDVVRQEEVITLWSSP
jgi:WD40 repeat protein